MYKVTTYPAKRPTVAMFALALCESWDVTAQLGIEPQEPQTEFHPRAHQLAHELTARVLSTTVYRAQAVRKQGRFVLVQYELRPKFDPDPDIIVCTVPSADFDRLMWRFQFARAQKHGNYGGAIEPWEWYQGVSGAAAEFVPLLHRMRADAHEADFVIGWLRAVLAQGSRV
jgi:hypothetical protein